MTEDEKAGIIKAWEKNPTVSAVSRETGRDRKSVRTVLREAGLLGAETPGNADEDTENPENGGCEDTPTPEPAPTPPPQARPPPPPPPLSVRDADRIIQEGKGVGFDADPWGDNPPPEIQFMRALDERRKADQELRRFITRSYGVGGTGGAFNPNKPAEGGAESVDPLADIGKYKEAIDAAEQKARAILQALGKDMPETVEKARGMLMAQGYKITDPRITLDQAQKMLEEARAKWEQERDDKTQEAVETKRLESAEHIILGVVDKLLGQFSPLINMAATGATDNELLIPSLTPPASRTPKLPPASPPKSGP